MRTIVQQIDNLTRQDRRRLRLYDSIQAGKLVLMGHREAKARNRQRRRRVIAKASRRVTRC